MFFCALLIFQDIFGIWILLFCEDILKENEMDLFCSFCTDKIGQQQDRFWTFLGKWMSTFVHKLELVND